MWPDYSSGPNAFPAEIRVVSANIASLETSCIDYDISYGTPIGPGNLTARLYANYLDKYQKQQYSGGARAQVCRCRGGV